MMLHTLWQVGSHLLSPTNALVAAIGLGLAMAALKGRSGFGTGLAALSATALCLIALLPVGNLLLAPLERRFPSPDHLPHRPIGILVLGGGVSLRDVAGTVRSQPNDAADRLFVAASLARQFPLAKVITLGGPIDPATGDAEADFAAVYLQQLGVPANRIIKERASADTFENARNATSLLHPKAADQWLLVTSAFHMPRAMGAFRRVGFHVIPQPADYRTVAGWKGLSWSAATNLRLFDVAVHEWIGLGVYRRRGWIGEIFPGPKESLP